MKTKNYKDNITLIVRDEDIFHVQKEILKQKLKGIKISTIKRYIQSFNPSLQANWTIKYDVYDKFKHILDELHYFKSSVLSGSFIEECIQFLDMMHLYDIDPQDLPTFSHSYLELKKMFEAIYDLPTESTYLKQIISEIPDLKDVYIDIQTPTFDEQIWMDALIKKQAQVIHQVESKPTYEYYHANNARVEIEAIAQKIIADHLDIHHIMIAYCDSKYSSIIASVFDRYQIPVHMRTLKASSIAFKCISLLKFAMQPNPETYMDCLIQGCFKNVETLIEAQKIYPNAYDEKYPEIDKICFKTELFSEQEIQHLIQLLSLAQKQKDAIREDCHQLATLLDIRQLFICVDEILRKNIHTKDDASAILKIQTIFRDSLPYIQDKEDLNIMMEEIQKIKCSETSKRFDAVSVIPFSKVNEFSDITFVCGATQSSFHHFQPLSGILDEDYVAQIKKFPTLMQRYEHAQNMLNRKIHNGQRIIFSYPQSDYVGKNQEASIDVESLVKCSSIPYTCTKANVVEESIQNLTKENAEIIYLKDHVIKGSISSLEKYIGCPYAYFLKYGAHIQEPLEQGFNVQKIGTLNHSVLETLTNKYSKNYTQVSRVELIDIIDDNIEDMKQVFPHLQFDLIRHRLIESMSLNLFILNDMENASSMEPTYSEYKWNKDLNFDDVTLRLVGYVDRIDTAPTTFRIIDYKSSQKKLEKDKVFSGQQLQLCTYLMQIQEELKLRPLGGFYYSFANPKFELPYQKLSRREKLVEEISKDKIIKEMLKNKRLQGWIFDDNVEIMDDTATHVLGITNTKSKGISARNVYDLQEVSKSIVEMMKIIVENILSGNVQCEPNEAACMFCKYRPICRFNGSFTEKKQLVELPACMRKEKEHE